ncbi:cation diffusion facilitator family transporter [Patescibacteria group bacterium]|nr:cation diffusion facilitator family transporter [Patescibacteria group bacterium]
MAEKENHGHSHSHVPDNLNVAFAVGIALNIALVIAEVGFGIFAHSVALLADAGHNFGDVLGLLLAWGALMLSRKNPTAQYTYGFRSTTILAALINGGFLLIATGAIVLEAVRRIAEPSPVAGGTVILVAAIAILINSFSAWLLRNKRNDLNTRGAFLHLVSDAAVSLGVLIGGLILLKTGWYWVDPVVSIGISLVIVWSTWGLLREAVNMSLDAVPTSINPAEVKKYLASLAGVVRIHDLHIWPIGTTEIALTCHLVMPKGHPDDAFMARVSDELRHKFGIGHTTLQSELGNEEDCALEPTEVV